MKGATIIANGSEPKGRFLAGILSGVCYPGMQLQIKAGVEPVNGNFTFEANSVAGRNAPAPILLEDENQGVAATVAWADGALGRLYYPLPGDEINVLMANISGTGDDFAIGDSVVVRDDGKFIADTGTPYQKHIVEETVPALTADTLVCVRW